MIDLLNLNSAEEEIGFETIPIGVTGADENDNVRITFKALSEVKKIKAQNAIPEDYGLRVGVKGGGCSGMSYTLGFDATSKDLDRIYETQGVKVFVDPKSLPYIDGTELDFAREGLNEGFKFYNPNVKDECGCGESFRI